MAFDFAFETTFDFDLELVFGLEDDFDFDFTAGFGFAVDFEVDFDFGFDDFGFEVDFDLDLELDLGFVLVAAIGSPYDQLWEPDLRDEPLGSAPFLLCPDDERDLPPERDLAAFRSVLLLTSPSSIVPRQPPSSASSSISA